jgi:hypothetical protein
MRQAGPFELSCNGVLQERERAREGRGMQGEVRRASEGGGSRSEGVGEGLARRVPAAAFALVPPLLFTFQVLSLLAFLVQRC